MKNSGGSYYTGSLHRLRCQWQQIRNCKPILWNSTSPAVMATTEALQSLGTRTSTNQNTLVRSLGDTALALQWRKMMWCLALQNLSAQTQDMESMVGLFINTLPGTEVEPWLTATAVLGNCGRQWIALRLLNIHHLWRFRVERGTRGTPAVRGNIVMFENYDLNGALRSQRETGNLENGGCLNIIA